MQKVSGSRVIASFDLFETEEKDAWEEIYEKVMDNKYKKKTRSYSKTFENQALNKPSKNGNVYLVTRQRGKSYKGLEFDDASCSDIQYCPISKGFSMQDLSGPIIGEGLCLVNAV